jgi:hypothetical protein
MGDDLMHARLRTLSTATRAMVVGASALVLRRRYLRWGATDEEVRCALPGDGLVTDTDLVVTRAITIRAPAVEVWPWLAQLGQGRGGFYSYDWLENLVGCDMRSADRIVPGWQRVEVGDHVRLHPEVELVVAEAEPGRSVVLQGGIPMGPVPAPYDFTWAFVLHADPDGRRTRLVVRERYEYFRWWSALLVEPVEVISAVMSRRMLRGVRDRAEEA